MITILYTITKEKDLIFAQPVNYTTKGEAEAILNDIHNDLKYNDYIKNIKYSTNVLEFTDTREGETDEIHKFEIIEKGGE